jgi:hypothetical protein
VNSREPLEYPDHVTISSGLFDELICDPTALPTAERAGLEAATWRQFLIAGLPGALHNADVLHRAAKARWPPLVTHHRILLNMSQNASFRRDASGNRGHEHNQ